MIIIAAAMTFPVYAQDCYPVNHDQISRIEADVVFLSDDALEGRYPGTAGADAARDVIAKSFEQAGLVPMGDGGFYQMFNVSEPVKVNKKKTFFAYNNDTLNVGEQFMATAFSSNAAITGKTVWVNYGITSPEKKYDDYKKVKSLDGMIAVMDISSPDGIHPHSEYAKYHDLGTRVNTAKEKGAIGVVLVNLGEMAEDVRGGYKKIRSAGIPVIFLKDDQVAKKIKKKKEITFGVQQKEKKVEAFNVIGFLDNQKPTTVVIGAHYDHLGFGGTGTGSLYKGEPAIHNGADDNASGTAALMELARYLGKREDLTGHNYLFVAFSAEEMGLLGSNYFVNNPTYDVEYMAYMVNMDMVGRMEDKRIQIGGTGTASEWRNVLDELPCKGFDYKLDPSGVGPSDHTSFYNANIPVLHFFTGTHMDYHKPSDDADKINYTGIAEVVSLIKTVMKSVDKTERLEFQQTKNENARKAPRFSVTLGIVPDYMYEDGGVRIDGVTEGKPASKAGLQKGDVIIQLGEIKVVDMYAYMNALAAFKKGDKTTVVYKRDGQEHASKIQF